MYVYMYGGEGGRGNTGILSASPSSDHAAVHGEPRHVHEEEEAGHDGGPADEGTGQGGESQETGRTVFLSFWLDRRI